MVKLETARKFTAIIANFSLLFNSFMPFLLVAQPTFAQDATPSSEIVQNTPAPTADPTIFVTPTSEPTVQPSSTATPTIEPTTIPTVEPTAQPTSEPSVTVEPTVSVEPTAIPTENSNPSSDTNPTATPQSVSNTPVEPSPTAIPTVLVTPVLGDSTSTSGQIETKVIANDACRTDLLNPQITSDKADYAPAEIAVITGSGFAVNTEYLLVVTAEGQFSQTYNITSDFTGNFTYSYRLYDQYIPNYKVELKSVPGIILATTTFTDSLYQPIWSCQNDLQGPNDEPGQKDLNLMCSDSSILPTTLYTKWNWDEISWSGSNTGDACNLIDTDNDSNANFSLCISVIGDPAHFNNQTLFSCTDNRPDRCTGSSQIIGFTSNCSASVSDKDPFSGSGNNKGDAYPDDTVATCTIQMSDFSSSNAKLIDVCSYPSQQPNSDPSDCIITPTTADVGTIEVIKILNPTTDLGKFNLQIDEETKISNVGNTGTTGKITLSTGDHSVGEIAGTGTTLSNYDSSISCINGSGTIKGTSLNSGPLNISLTKNEDILCTITNTHNAYCGDGIVNNNEPCDDGNQVDNDACSNSCTVNNGHIIVQKTTYPSADPTNFIIDISTTNGTVYGSTRGTVSDATDYTFDVSAGTYKITEALPGGWAETSNPCLNDFTVAAGETKTCLIENKKLPVLTVEKVLVGDTTPYNNFLFVLDGWQTFPFESDGNNQIYVAPDQTYNITETNPGSNYHVSYSAGCSGTLTYNQTATCTITNTKYGNLTIVKNADPDSTQPFGFTTSGAGLTAFALSDDGISGHSNSRTFTNLLPGTYLVTENSTPNWDLNEASCSDGSSNTAINLSAGENITCTFTNTMQGNIGGHKYNDADGNIATSGDRTNVEGWTIELWQNDTKIDETLTTVAGYSFSNLQPGTYELRESLKVGWIALHPTSTKIDVTLSPGENDFGNDFINAENATVTVHKNVDTDGDGDIDITNSSGWTWDITGKLDNQTDTTVSNLAPGNYTISEDQQNGYHVTSLVCNNGLTNPNNNYGAVESKTITLTSGQDLDCTFTNTRDTGTLIVKKVVINDNSGNKSAFDFTFKIGDGAPVSFEADGQNDITVNAGTYTITEPAVSGYATTYNNCSSVVIPNGGSATCTITNDDTAPSLTLNKILTNDNGSTALESAWTLTANGGNIGTLTGQGAAGSTDVVSGSSFKAGTYTLSESGPSGYNASVWTCTNGITVNGNNEITLGLGQSTVCSITNNDIQPKLTVTKVVIGSSATPADFDIYVGKLGIQPVEVVSGVQTGFNTGTYYVTETAPGYTTVISGDCATNGSITLNPGNVKSCTVTNTRNTGTIELKKSWSGTGGQTTLKIGTNPNGNEVDSQQTGANGATPLTTGQNTVITGNYYLSETNGLTNYTASPLSCFNDVNNNGINNTEPVISVGANDRVSVAKDQHIVCTFTNTRNTGTLRVLKNVDLNGDGDYTDTNETGATNWHWQVDGGSDHHTGDNAITLSTGTYHLTETNQPNYHVTGLTCTPNGSVDDSDVTITKGTNVVCTFTNARDTGTVIVHKDVRGPNGEDITDTSTTFTSRLDGNDSKTLTDNSTITYSNVITGNHSITEYNPSSSYDYYSITPDSNNNKTDGAQITVTSGQTTHVYITNRQKKGRIYVVKNVVSPTSGSVSDNHHFTAQLNSGNNKTIAEDITNNYYEVNPGPSYTISELDDANYDEIGCKLPNNSLSTNFTVASNESITVTCTNKQKPATITVVKNVKAADGTTEVADNYTFKTKLDGSNEKSFSENTSAVYSVAPGDHYITENSNSNYIYVGCTPDSDSHNNGAQFNVGSNESKTITCVNKQQPSSITIVKNSHPDSTTDFEFTRSWGSNFTLEDDGNNHDGQYSSKEFNGLNGGSYTVTEKTPDMYWYLGDIACTGDASVSEDFPNRSVTISTKPGEDTTCTFHNYKKGRIEGEKFYDKNGNNQDDSGEPDLKDWKIFIDENGNGQYDSGERYDMTDHDGDYSFDKLMPGTYRICEEMQTGWYPTNNSGNCKTTTIHNDGDDTDVLDFANRQFGSINVCKVIIDANNNLVNGSEVLGSNFTVDWDKNLADSLFSAGYQPNTKIFGDSEGNDAFCRLYENLLIDTYHYSTESINGDTSIWESPKYNDQYESSVDDINDFYTYNQNTDSNGEINLALDAGINRTLVILNQYKHGSINVTKFNDRDGDKTKDDNEEVLDGWTINLTDQVSKNTDENGQVNFDKLIPSTYYLSEDMQPGWTQTNIYCDGQNEDPTPTPTPTPTPAGMVWCHRYWGAASAPQCLEEERTNCEGNGWEDDKCPTLGFNLVKSVNAEETPEETGYKISLDAGQNLNCYIGNQLVTPHALISKWNNANIDGQDPGSSVGFKIKVIITDNNVNNFQVTDLPSNGFKYRLGSYGVSKNGSDITGSITEPVYHSPGVWNLGNLNVGDTLELTYTADISSDQQPGKYKDLAWGMGQTTYDNNVDVIASSQPVGFVDENFVGTDVLINKNTQNTVSAGVEKEEIGQVLGASTDLPYTGASTIWLLISTLMFILGLSLVKKSSKKLLTILFLLNFYLFPNNALAISNISLRVEQPKTPTNTNDVNLNFVALDINNQPITVRCLKKSPSDSSFTQFGANINLTAGGNANHCSLSSILSSEGNYQFQLTATSSETVTSSIIPVDYKTSGPGTPGDYRKEHPNTCDYKIYFKTADDGGKTVKVDLYRSDVTSFNLDSGSYITSLAVSSNQEYNITNTVPDCSKNYYYVLRAYDSASNGSGTIGDSVVKIINNTTNTATTTTSTNQTAAAIPVANANIAPEEATTTTTETPTPSTTTVTEDADVLGTQNTIPTFLQKYWLPLAIALLVIISIITYVLSRRKRSY